ncbi:hypothetical protein [Mucilaginibacter jinjuensis]|uniref:Uncharacterized protein n=1 Tax=Mucilaginibacter jinjuensis TaxID=1176721 RepID=A0ABY7TEJ9_9SPHI|nr:hypothetical protein [Mucilaginibacter jinjuensis]WCT14466.1 hypothetical protein PQO05_11030 [Mucilaginibacter jinjuensis]
MDINKDFAFASGGIIWRIIDRPKFEAKTLRYKISMVVILAMMCWLPLALLSLFQLGTSQFYLLFVRDIATHVRFLLAFPILLFARSTVNHSFNHAITFFYETKLVDKANSSQFERILDKLKKWKKLKIIDGLIILLIFFLFFTQGKGQTNNASIYAPWYLLNNHITLAGWWYLILSLPIFQMLLYRWIYTIFLWIVFLRLISKIHLNLSSFHPDGVGGLGFLRYTQLSFFPIALAFSALTAGVTNNLIIFSGISISDYKIAIGTVIIFSIFLFIIPLLLLIPLLVKTKRKYFMEYSLQAWPIARKYEDELDAFYQKNEGTPDSSWHVDLIGSFEKTQEMKISLVDKDIIFAFLAAIIFPFLPVVAQQIPLKQVFFDVIGKVLG